MLRFRQRPGLLTRYSPSLIDTGTAAPLPTASTANALYMSNGGTQSNYTRFDLSAIAIPSGDWSIGFFCKVAASPYGTQVILSAGTATNPYSSASTLSFQYSAATGQISCHGLDASSNPLGQHSPPLPASNTNANALKSTYPMWPGDAALVVVVKTGNFAQMWMKFNGHAPVKVSESYTVIGAITASAFLGVGKDSSNGSNMTVRNLFKLSYALTKDQIDQIGNGTDPTTLGTPAANDFYFLLNANSTTITSTINSITMTRTFNNATIATGVGYEPQTEAVFLDPVGPDGKVVQHIGGSATVSLSGTYRGTDGADIQAQFIDGSNTAFRGWRTVASAATGKTWSGSLSVPKGKRWIKVQLRKVISGTPSTDVMTTTLRWGVGEVVFLCGQSLMEHMGSTGNPSGSSIVDPNGFTSTQIDVMPQVTLANRKQISVTGVANNGSGLIRVTFSGRHGQAQNSEMFIQGVGGTTEANGRWTVTPVSLTAVDLQGSTFTNAYTSGGVGYIWNDSYNVMNRSLWTTPDGHTIIANAISNLCNSVVCISNQAVGGQAIGQFNSLTASSGVNNYSNTAILAARRAGKVGAYLWLHGHNDIGRTGYFMDSGTWGSEVGFGDLGTLYDLLLANFPNSDFGFGVAAFHSIGGTTAATAANIQGFRHAARRWVTRKGGYTFFLGYFNDFQPRWENGTTQNAHLTPVDYRKQASRLGQSTSFWRGSAANDAKGPAIVSAVRSGAVITLTVTQNGGSALRVQQTGAVPSGFEVATDTAFTTKKTISNVELVDATTIRITLSADPGASCYVRYQYGMVGDYGTSTYMTLRVTGVADNGSGLIRVTMANPVTPATPSGSQRAALLTDVSVGQWVQVANVAGATQANGIWQINAKGTDWIDLASSSSAGLGTFTANADLYASSATGVVMLELAVPVYDDRTIGGYDTNGSPLQPTDGYVTAS